MRDGAASGSRLARAILALTLAYGLVLHAVAGAVASGARAGAAIGAAEHALCLPEPRDGARGPGAADHHPALCILSCGLVPAGVLPAATLPASEARRAMRSAAVRVHRPLFPNAPRPFEARAPPSVLA